MRTSRLAIAIALLLTSHLGAEQPEDRARADIRALFEETFTERWRSADPDGLAQIWLEDGEWMSLIGSRRVYRGREAIADIWRVGLQGRDSPAALALSAEVEHVRLLNGDLAHADVLFTFGSEATGTIRESMFAVLRKTPSGWRIASARVARLVD